MNINILYYEVLFIVKTNFKNDEQTFKLQTQLLSQTYLHQIKALKHLSLLVSLKIDMLIDLPDIG